MNRKTFPSARSTANVGGDFENLAQSLFTVLMLTRGSFSHLPAPWQVAEMQFQTKKKGYATSDFLVIFRKPDGKEERKMLVEVKLSIKVQERSEKAQKKEEGFEKVLMDAWKDFCNPEIFQKERDSIALITGVLSAVDTAVLRYLFNDTKYKNDAGAIRQETELRGATPPQTAQKHQIILNILQKANAGKRVSDQEFKDFADHFHLIFMDSGDELNGSMSETLLIDIVSQFQPENPKQLLARIRNATQEWNGRNGEFTVHDLPEDILDIFAHGRVSKHFMPEKFSSFNDDFEIEKSLPDDAMFLARAALAGAWDDQNEHDQSIVARLLKKEGNYADCSEQAQRISGASLGNIPLVYKGNIWQIKDRVEIMQSMGKRFIDSDINVFTDCAITVLKERDPAWELPPETRYMANVIGAAPKYSKELRHGLVEGLAILANSSAVLERCRPDMGKYIAESVVWKIFSNVGSPVWGSMNDLLPTFAEAAPHRFLEMVRKALNQSPCPFDELFGQEGDGITGKNYMTGTLWAMECLAWDKDCVIGACTALGKLAKRDPGGQWSNRPFNSLVNILLPWMPKSKDSWGKRKIAMETLVKEVPEIAFKLLLSLLPGATAFAMNTYKPKWRAMSEEPVLRKQYIEEVRFYSRLIIEAVQKDVSRLTMLIDKLAYFPEDSFNQLAEILKSSPIIALSEEDRFPLWQDLMKLGDEWRIQKRNERQVGRIEEIANILAPKSPFYYCQRIFGNKEFYLLDGKGDREEQYVRLSEARDVAIEELLDECGIEGVIRFIKEPDVSPHVVGYALGSVDSDAEKIEHYIFPGFLDSSDLKIEYLTQGLIRRKFKDESVGWKWFGDIDKSNWTSEQKGCFLSFLPLEQKTWELASELLGEDEKEYWSRIGKANFYWRLGKNNLSHAIKMLIEHGNSSMAVQLLGHMLHNDGRVDVAQCIQALKSLHRLDINSNHNAANMLQYDIGKLVDFLQSDDSVNAKDMIEIEWAYLGILNTPKHLEKEMAYSPEFFCEVVRTAIPLKEDEEKHGKLDYVIMRKAFELLHNWKTIPGFNESDVMDIDFFKNWILGVKENCKKDFYWEMSLDHIGRVLMCSPEDSDGLWINRSVAEILNEDSNDADAMRDGFNRGTFNSQGVRFIDPTGEPERKLAEEFQSKADQLEKAGFSLFATGVRELASDYERERKRVIDSEKNRND